MRNQVKYMESKSVMQPGDGLFADNDMVITEQNAVVLKIISITMLLIFSGLLAVSFFSQTFSYTRPMYVLYTALLAVYVLFVSHRWLPILFLGYCIQLIVLSYCIISDSFFWHDYITVTILADLILFPALVLDKIWRLVLIDIASAAIYLIIILRFKADYLLLNTIVNVIGFCLIGCVIGAFFGTLRLRSVQTNTLVHTKMERLRMSDEKYRHVLKCSGNIICEFNVEQRIISTTPELAVAFSMPETVYDVPYSPVREGSISRSSSLAYINLFEDIMRGSSSGSAEYEALSAGGSRWWNARYSTIFSDDGKPASALILLTDITEQHKREQMIQTRANLDGLTGIYNRGTAESAIRQRLFDLTDTAVVLMIIDLDDFKQINDLLGHPQGDRALKLLAQAIVSQFRKSDIAGRWGGDEFIVLLNGISNIDEAKKRIASFMERLSTLYVGKSDVHSLHASIGGVFADTAAHDFNYLYDKADKALYQAKRNGKNQFVLLKS